MGRRSFGTREPRAHNETLHSVHPDQSEGDPEHGIPHYPPSLPGEHEYPEREEIERVKLAVPPHLPYYMGGTTHGVKAPEVGERIATPHDERDFYRTEAEAFPLHGPYKGEAVPVYITDQGKLIRASFRQVTLIAGGSPIVLCPRNDQRDTAYLLNESVSFSAGSTGGSGSVTNPGALATIATTGVLPAGTYSVTATGFLSGTVTGADQANMRVSPGNFTLPVPGVINVPGPVTAVITLASAQAITVQSIGAASGASAVYNATIVATPVAAAGVGAGVRLKNGPRSDIGALLPASQSRYFPVKTQDEIWAQLDSTASVEQLVSVIETYSQRI